MPTGWNVSDAPFAFPEGGFAEGGPAGLVGICRLRRGFLFPEGVLVAVGAVPPGRGARGRLEMVL